MKTIVIFNILIALACCVSLASAEEDYWAKARKFMMDAENAKTPGARAVHHEAWIKYLKSLTKKQLLTALRQYGKEVEATPPPEREWAPVISMRILSCYAEPLKRSDLSNEKFQKMRRGKQRSLEAGLIPARFTNKSFEKLIAGISDRKEGTYFRYTLIDVLRTKNFYPILSKTQMEQFLNTCLAVSSDRESPDMVREKCLEAFSYIFQREYSRIIHANDVVEELRGTGLPTQSRELSSLLNSGKVKLTAKTLEQLEPWRQKVKCFRKALVALQEDERASKSLKGEAKSHLHLLDRLPLLNVPNADSKPLKD